MLKKDSYGKPDDKKVKGPKISGCVEVSKRSVQRFRVLNLLGLKLITAFGLGRKLQDRRHWTRKSAELSGL